MMVSKTFQYKDWRRKE